MKKRLYLSFLMALSAIYQPVQAISPEEATVGAVLTALGITGASYALVRQASADSDKKNKNNLREIFWTGVFAAPLSYCASVLWLGLTPEWRYIFASKAADDNCCNKYAVKRYDSAQELVEDLNGGYLSRLWLVELHKDLTIGLGKTNKAIKGWHDAFLEDRVENFPLIKKDTLVVLKEQKACLEHNLFLLRDYRPFQEQQNAWMCRKSKFEIMHC